MIMIKINSKALLRKKSLLIIWLISVLLFSFLVTIKSVASQPSEYQFKITFVGTQEKIIKSIGFANGTFNLNTFLPYRTPGIFYGNDEIYLTKFSVTTYEASNIVGASRPYMNRESNSSISFMIWNGTGMTEALLTRRNATNLLCKLAKTLDSSNINGINQMKRMINVLGLSCIPNITILSPVNNSYHFKMYVPLNFMNNTILSWTGYSLNGTANKTINGSYNITVIPNGLNSITVFANDTSGNMGKSDTNYFFYCLADINQDRKVDVRDVYFIGRFYGGDCIDNPSKYNAIADLNDDCKVDVKDYYKVSQQYGKTC